MNCKTKGHTLIELVMVITIVGVLVGVSSMFVKETVDLWNFITFRNEIVSQARIALMRMLRDIRHADIMTAADTSSLSFTDINNNNISYSLLGTNLMRGSDILASNVSSVTFAYYNNKNSLLTPLPLSAENLAVVYRITIQLRLEYGGQSIILNSEAFLRNYS